MTTVLVTFTDAWLTDVTNPSVSIHASFEDRKSQTATGGRFAELAGGRTRVITTASKTATFPLVLQLLDDADAALLDLWQGRLLLLRDQAGRRVFGSFLAGDSLDYDTPEGTLHDVTITFTRVTYSEAV